MSNKTKETFQVIDFGLLAIRETTQGIRKSLGKELHRNKKAESVKRKSMQRLLDRKKKDDIEKLQENQKPNLASKSVSNLAKSSGNFITRIIKALGVLVVGYLGMKLPEVIEGIKKVIDTTVAIGKFIGDFVKDIISIGASIVDLVKEFVVQIKEFDFDGDKIKEKFDAIGVNIDSLQTNWDKNSRNLRDKIKQFETDGEKAIAGTLSGERTGALLKLQEQRDSGELSEDDYQKEVLKLYEVEEDPKKPVVEKVSKSLDKNMKVTKDNMGPAEFFGTNQYGDGAGTGAGTTEDSSGSTEGGTGEVTVDTGGELNVSIKDPEPVKKQVKKTYTKDQVIAMSTEYKRLVDKETAASQGGPELTRTENFDKKVLKYKLDRIGVETRNMDLGGADAEFFNAAITDYNNRVGNVTKEAPKYGDVGGLITSNSKEYNIGGKPKKKIEVPISSSGETNLNMGGQTIVNGGDNSTTVIVKKDNSIKKLSKLSKAFT